MTVEGGRVFIEPGIRKIQDSVRRTHLPRHSTRPRVRGWSLSGLPHGTRKTSKLRAIAMTTDSMKTEMFDYKEKWRSFLFDSTPYYYYPKCALRTLAR
jgi:hypothetical protein